MNNISGKITLGRECNIYIGTACEVLKEVLPKQRVIAIIDRRVAELYPDFSAQFETILFDGGEGNKTIDNVVNIQSELLKRGADRKTFILGIGGGITTDVVGFVAATYMRGVRFGFISTTLLGQVDASIGGKNGVNLHDYKNIIGTFTHPTFVISDPSMLGTLPRRELRAGMAEVVKSAIIADAELFEILERADKANIYSNTTLAEAVMRSAIIKRDIVEQDEREAGMRRLLNLGHTLGHAIEKCTHEVNHGEAVAMGLSLISHVAAKRNILAQADAERIDTLLLKLGFELTPPVPMRAILDAVKYDKKKDNDLIHLVLPEAIGRCRIEQIPMGEISAMF